jgi:hypothetical protein
METAMTSASLAGLVRAGLIGEVRRGGDRSQVAPPGSGSSAWISAPALPLSAERRRSDVPVTPS